jgi:hypothetical protein
MPRVQFSVTGYRGVLKSLDPGVAQRAARAALKRTLERTRTQFTRTISGAQGRYTVPAAEVRGKMVVSVPTGGFEGVLRISGSRLPVTKFKHRMNRFGLVVEILKHGGRRLIQSVFLPRRKGGGPIMFNGQPLAFIRKKTDRPNPFHQAPDSRNSTGQDSKGRKRRWRLPLASVRTLSVPKMVSTERFRDREFYGDFMLKRFAYEFQQALIGLHALKTRGTRAP